MNLKLEDAVAAFEGRFETVSVGEPRAYFIENFGGDDVTRVYVTIRRGEDPVDGWTEKPDLFPPAQTPEEAVAQWFAVACSYAARVGGKRLVWRVKPELGQCLGGWQVYSRLVVI